MGYRKNNYNSWYYNTTNKNSRKRVKRMKNKIDRRIMSNEIEDEFFDEIDMNLIEY
jgi:hypothetical protein